MNIARKPIKTRSKETSLEKNDNYRVGSKQNKIAKKSKFHITIFWKIDAHLCKNTIKNYVFIMTIYRNLLIQVKYTVIFAEQFTASCMSSNASTMNVQSARKENLTPEQFIKKRIDKVNFRRLLLKV